jgi:hypothetical protein
VNRLAVAAPLVALLALAPGAGAAKVEEVVTSGQVTATLSYDKRKDATFDNFHLKIDRAGVTLVDADLSPGCRRNCLFYPANQGAGEDSVRVRDLDADGEPEVIADLYTGGAHCCTVSTLYGFDAATAGYRRVVRNWLDAGYFVRDFGRDGVVELESRDARFAFRFASYAESFLPLQVFRYRDGGLVDVTERFRRQLREDARRALRLWRRYKDNRNVNPLGFLAGWVADKYRLGQRRDANRALRRALRRGDLRSRSPFAVGKSGRRYVKDLKRFLRRLGY